MSHAEEKDKQLHNHVEISDLMAHWIVLIFAIPIGFVGSVLGQFVRRTGAGSQILGVLAFGFGTILSADSVWQTMFKGVPIFPWYESEWIGWQGWLTLPFNLIFWISVLIAYLVIRVEARTLRGTSPDKARADYQESLKYELPKKPNGVIDLTRKLWGRYKRAGLSSHRNFGLIALGFWVFDLWTTFAGRWPWRYTEPMDIICCLFYNIAAMSAGEIGYTIWKEIRKEAQIQKPINK